MITTRTVTRTRSELLAWYANERRDFPWRATHDPYAVLVSEVMLQQTQASRVVGRFERFMRRFPSAATLASATDAEVLAEWSGLGYNRRALGLRRAATRVARDGWPRDVRGLRGLPGVGPYTARAIGSLAFGMPVGVVDTNVRRWLLRRFAVEDRPSALQALADDLAAAGSGADVADWTHATMEFGAKVCRSRNARCEACPIASGCPARGAAPRIPVPRQPALRGTDRAYRGELLRVLSAADQHAMAAGDARRRVGAGIPGARWERILRGLERDGLVHRSRGMVRLGATTIGP